uniref:Congested-like trachea protein n=1 Tax=Cacopsylla melanoneura TaxID=428564 RepID=A0A8D8T9H6_9HEMI
MAENPVKYFFAGGVGGVLTVLVGHPFDTVKVRLQTMSADKPMYTGTFDCFSKIVRNENIVGLYKGMGAPITGVSPIFALSFLGYGTGKKLLTNSNNDPLSPWQYFVAGSFSGVATAAITAPGERIKCLLQVQHSDVVKVYSGPVDVVKKLVKQHGIGSVFKGLCATLLRDIPANGAYFITYEMVKQYLASRSLASSHSGADGSESGAKPAVSMLSTIFAGGCAGIMYWVVGMPADVLKSRLQTAPEGTYPHGVRSVLTTTLKKEGPAALYRGAVPVFLRAFPANAACFLGVEYTLSLLNRFS